MSHGENDLGGLVVGGALQGFIEEGNQSGDAFQGEALGSQVARLNDLLEGVGLNEKLENPLLIDLFRLALETFLDPAPTLRVGYVHELDTDCA